MQSKKTSKTHTSTRKKASALAKTPARTKKAASKATKSARKAKPSKKTATEERPKWLRKRDELLLKIFRWAYEANQQGKFRRL